MKRILDLPDDEIAHRVALRAACNGRAGAALKAARRRAEEEHFAATRAKTPSAFPDDVVRDAARLTFKWTGPPDEAARAEIDALKAAAEDALPSAIKSERWEVGDCGCVVHRVYHVDAPDDAQTYAVERYCEAHEGLSVEELHDTHERETKLRANAHRLLSDDCQDTFGEPRAGALEWRWEGKGATRKLCVESCHMTDERAAALSAAAVELGEPGAIKATVTRQE